jgi:enterochelin esterase-like enzyme
LSLKANINSGKDNEYCAQQNNFEVLGKKVDMIHSVILNEDRYIDIHVPKSTIAPSTYPVIYILDGQVLFDEVTKALQDLSKAYKQDMTEKKVLWVSETFGNVMEIILKHMLILHQSWTHIQLQFPVVSW